MLSTSESSIDIQGSCFFVAKFLALSHTQKLIEIGCRYSELGIQPNFIRDPNGTGNIVKFGPDRVK